jgi:hypothetical protein
MAPICCHHPFTRLEQHNYCRLLKSLTSIDQSSIPSTLLLISSCWALPNPSLVQSSNYPQRLALTRWQWYEISFFRTVCIHSGHGSNALGDGSSERKHGQESASVLQVYFRYTTSCILYLLEYGSGGLEPTPPTPQLWQAISQPQRSFF